MTVKPVSDTTMFKISLLNQNHLASLKLAFDLMDTDGSGEIGPIELKEVANKFSNRFTDKQLEDMIKESDEFGSGEISFEEFIEFMVTKITKKSNSDPILKEVFDYFVGENSGLMGPEQLKQMMNDNGEKLTAAELVQMMDEASIIDEGSINYKDFIRPIDFPEDDI